jgi:1-deoxy-D-xylulose-5-phosphate synthase
MLRYAVNEHDGPIAVRYPRGGTQAFDSDEEFRLGRAVVLGTGSDAVIITAGRMLKTAQDAAAILEKRGIGVKIVSLRTIKPIDADTLADAVSGAGCAVTLEDGTINGGIGSMAAAALMERGAFVKFRALAFPDVPIKHGSIQRLDKFYGMDAASVAKNIEELLN